MAAFGMNQHEETIGIATSAPGLSMQAACCMAILNMQKSPMEGEALHRYSIGIIGTAPSESEKD